MHVDSPRSSCVFPRPLCNVARNPMQSGGRLSLSVSLAQSTKSSPLSLLLTLCVKNEAGGNLLLLRNSCFLPPSVSLSQLYFRKKGSVVVVANSLKLSNPHLAWPGGRVVDSLSLGEGKNEERGMDDELGRETGGG